MINLSAMILQLPDDCIKDIYSSPVGNLTILASHEGLHALLWDKQYYSKQTLSLISSISNKTEQNYIKTVKKQLDEYFKGKRKKFDIPISIRGTEFQQKAWKHLSKIPYGKTISYQEQAIALGDKNKVRAIGSANGKNPLSIIVPCHRVIAKNGNLTGFAGGISAKKYLLDHEQAQL